jgi:hypothetical protein
MNQLLQETLLSCKNIHEAALIRRQDGSIKAKATIHHHKFLVHPSPLIE